jgi:diguanylate cyclase
VDERAQYKTALNLAKRALDYIAKFGTPPTPHAFELFYTVCAGQNAPLNEALRRATSDKQTLSAAEMENLYQEYLTQEPQSHQMETIGSKMGNEMTGLMSLLGTAATTANTYQASLQNAEERLSSPQAGQNMSEMVRSLHAATQTMARANLEVSANLETSRAQVELLEDCLKEAREESSRDPLTGLVNRRRFDIMLDETLLSESSENEPACLLVIDIDNFKVFNDSHGHVAGDSALRYVASCIKSNIKGQDTAARYGGEEFAVILPNTSIEHAMGLAERIRHLVNARHLVKKATGVDMGRISVSIGVTMNEEGDSAESFLHRADMCMYAAKNAGRNQVQDSPAPQSEESTRNVEIDAA